MTETVAKTFIGGDGKEYHLDVPAPPPAPQKSDQPPPPTAREVIDKIPAFYAGLPEPMYNDWTDAQKIYLRMVGQMVLQMSGQIQQIAHALRLLIKERDEIERDKG